MDAWIKIFVIIIMLSLLSWVANIVFYNPLMGLIMMGAIVTMLIAVVEPATGKATAQVTIPLILVLFAIQVITQPSYSFDLAGILLVGAVLYFLFAVFTGGSSGIEGGLMDPGIAIKLFPLYGIVFFLSGMADPTYRLTAMIMIGTVFLLMLLYMLALRGYDKWPLYEYGKTRDIEAVTDINPRGKVKSGSEIWWAKTIGPPIKTGERVDVVAIDGLTLIVSKRGVRDYSERADASTAKTRG
ncbi:MAG: NfeD family protein [Candidatus Thorarchaeota archaeon]